MNVAEIAGLVTSVGSLIGVLVLWRKSRPEIKKISAESKKVMAEESRERVDAFRIEVDTIREAYAHMLEDQVKSVIGPMKDRIDRLAAENKEIRKEIKELREYRSLFETAVLYIRALCHWVSSLDGIDVSKKPILPEDLKVYFNLYDKKREKENEKRD